MKRSIFLKIFGGYLIISLALAFLILLFAFNAFRSFYLDTLANDLQNLGNSLKLQVAPLLRENRYAELDAFLKDFGQKIGTRITVIDREGIVLADSDENPSEMDNHGFRPEIMTAFSGSVGRSVRYSRTVNESMLYVAQPVDESGTVSNVLRVSLYVKDINDLLVNVRKNIWLFGLIIIIISLVGALFFSRSLAKPLQELSSASRRIADGNFNTKVFLRKGDEFRDLAESFNFMTEHIKRLFDELSTRKEQLNSILRSMEEGLIVLDENGRIVMTNASFQQIVQSEEIEGKLYWEVIRDPVLGDLIQKVKDEKRNYADDIELSGKFYLASVTLIPAKEEIVVTFHDITEIRRVERIKKDFILNVSHELRTPLTAIKGFVETIEQDAAKKHKNYLEIIKRNTDRLINIVKDLLVQSELDDKYIRLEMEDVDVSQLIANIGKIFEPQCEQKGLAFRVHTESDFPKKIKGDPFKLEQLFVNVIDNSVKYTEKGGITINLSKINHDVFVTIEDTGIGIPEAELPRIFERFYVVDKSRSRRLGGTGLGLSIVKHIVLLHNGEVSIKSSVNQGTKVTVRLPV